MNQVILTMLFYLSLTALVGQTPYPVFEYRNAKDTTAYLRAVDEYTSKEYVHALKTLRKLTKRYAHDAAIHRLRALCLEELGQFNEARHAVGMAMAESPEAYGLFTERARLWFREQNYRAQAADLCAYLVYDPKCIAVIYKYLHALRELNQNQSGIAFLTSFPDKDAGLYNLLGHFYIQAEQYDSAIATMEQTLSMYPNYEPAYEGLTMACYFAGQHEKALATADKLIALNSRHAYAFALKAWIYDGMGLEFEAQQYYDLAENMGYVFEPDTRF
jgi:tetratricopeptide (TPR) repeat protein